MLSLSEKTVLTERQTLRLSRQRRRMTDKDNRSGLLWSTQRWNVSVWYLFTISPQARKAAVRACDMPIEIIFCFMRNHIKESLHKLPKPWCLCEEMCAICRLIYLFFLRSFSNRILTQTKKRQKSIKNTFGMFGIYHRLRCFKWKNTALLRTPHIAKNEEGIVYIPKHIDNIRRKYLSHLILVCMAAVFPTSKKPLQKQSGSTKTISENYTVSFPSLLTKTAGISEACTALRISLTPTATRWAKACIRSRQHRKTRKCMAEEDHIVTNSLFLWKHKRQSHSSLWRCDYRARWNSARCVKTQLSWPKSKNSSL